MPLARHQPAEYLAQQPADLPTRRLTTSSQRAATAVRTWLPPSLLHHRPRASGKAKLPPAVSPCLRVRTHLRRSTSMPTHRTTFQRKRTVPMEASTRALSARHTHSPATKQVTALPMLISGEGPGILQPGPRSLGLLRAALATTRRQKCLSHLLAPMDQQSSHRGCQELRALIR